jgi:F-type H+-transporting ATPase subunit delta
MKTTAKVRRAARDLFHLCHVDGRLDAERVRLVARQLAGSRRRGAFAILSAFQRLVRLDRDRHTAHVESATPLTATLQDGIRSGLLRTYGQGLEAVFAENPALIGGVRIKVGSDVYDGSIRARLAELESRL